MFDLTLQVESLAPVVPQLLQEQPQHGTPQSGLLSLCCRFVVQNHHVRFTPLDKFLLVLVVGDDGADGEVALLQPPEHEPRDGQVDGRLDVRGLVQLMGSAVQQQQSADPGLQLLLQPLHALTRHRHHSHDHRASPQMINFHEENVNPLVPCCDMENTTEQRKRGKITALNFPSRGRRRRCSCRFYYCCSCGRAHTRTQHTLPHASNTHAPIPLWPEQETWTCRGFFPSFLQSDRSEAFIPVHRRPFVEPGPNLRRPRINKLVQRYLVRVSGWKFRMRCCR